MDRGTAAAVRAPLPFRSLALSFLLIRTDSIVQYAKENKSSAIDVTLMVIIIIIGGE